MTPSIYDFADVRAWFCAWLAHHPDSGTRKLRRWVGRQLKLKASALGMVIGGERGFQSEWVDALSSMASLEGDGREYLRRLIALQGAGPREAGDVRRSVWEVYAARQGSTKDEMARLLQVAPPLVGTALLPALPLLAELPGMQLEPVALDQALHLAPSPGELGSVLARYAEGARFGRVVSRGLCALPGPEAPLGDEVWDGLYTLARHSLLAFPPHRRDYHALVWAADGQAADEIEAANARLDRDLRRFARRYAGRPVDQVALLLTETHRASDLLRPPNRSRVVVRGLSLPLGAWSGIAQVQPAQPSGAAEPSPCLYHYLELTHFARTWLAMRQDRKQAFSITRLAERAGMSRTLIHELINGATLPRPEHLAGLRAAFGISEEMAPYLEGMSRYALAPDPLAKARERALLTRYAAEHGARTISSEQYRFLSHWAPLVVHELASLAAWHPLRSWIHYALRGRVSIDQAEDILETLRFLGLLDPATGRPRSGTVVLGEELGEGALQAGFALHDSVLELLAREQLFPDPAHRGRGWAIALPDEAWGPLLDLLRAHQRALLQLLEAASARPGRDRVLIVGTQLFPLARPAPR